MKRRAWTAAEVDVLRALYPDTPTAEIAERLGREVRAVYAKAKQQGLAKSPEYLASPAAARIQRGQGKGSATRFRPGHAPWNKGTAYRPTGRAVESQFKPGNVPHTQRPIGTERIRDGYLWRKIRDDLVPVRHNWREVHRIVWEEANGPIPDGYCVVFKSADRLDVRLENLELISRQQLAARNSMYRLPPELQKTIRVKSALTRQIKKLTKESHP